MQPVRVAGAAAAATGDGVHVVREEVGPEEEPADGAERAHGVHDTDVHGGVVALHVVVHVGGAQREQRGATATEEKLRMCINTEKLSAFYINFLCVVAHYLSHHKDEDGHGRGLVGLLDAVVLPVVVVVVRTELR